MNASAIVVPIESADHTRKVETFEVSRSAYVDYHYLKGAAKTRRHIEIFYSQPRANRLAQRLPGNTDLCTDSHCVRIPHPILIGLTPGPR